MERFAALLHDISATENLLKHSNIGYSNCFYSVAFFAFIWQGERYMELRNENDHYEGVEFLMPKFHSFQKVAFLAQKQFQSETLFIGINKQSQLLIEDIVSRLSSIIDQLRMIDGEIEFRFDKSDLFCTFKLLADYFEFYYSHLNNLFQNKDNPIVAETAGQIVILLDKLGVIDYLLEKFNNNTNRVGEIINCVSNKGTDAIRKSIAERNTGGRNDPYKTENNMYWYSEKKSKWKIPE